MKTPSDLFDLVHSLSGSEKRYLKLKASFHAGPKQYLELWSILESQPQYDPDSLARIWEQQYSLSSLAVTKNYLYEFLLATLEQYHASKGKKLAILTLLRRVDILFDKTLYRQCGKLLQRARKLTLQIQSPRMELEILIWEYRILLSPKYQGELKRSMEDILAREAQLLQQLSLVNAARSMRFKVESGNAPDRSGYEEWQKKFEVDLPPGLVCEYYRACALYLRTKGRLTEAVTELKRELDLLESQIHLMTDKGFFSKYESCLETLIRTFHEMGDARAARQYLEKLNPTQLPKPLARYDHLLIKATVLYYTLLLAHLQIKEEPVNLRQALAEVESSEYLWQHDIRWHYIAPLLYSMAVSYRALGEYSPAIQKLSVFFSQTLLQERQRFFLDATWLFMILHYERGKLEIVETYHHSMRRRLRTGIHPEPADQYLLKLFGHLINSPSRDLLQHHFRAFRKKLLEMQIPLRKGVFDYIKWSGSFLHPKETLRND